MSAVYVYGRLTERVKSQGEALKDHNKIHEHHDHIHESIDNEQDRQWSAIREHGERIASVEGKLG